MRYEKNNKKGLTWLNISLLILLIISLVIFIIAVYFLYMNLPGEPKSLEIQSEYLNDNLSKTIQFYPNLKFNHNEISFNIDPNCDAEKKDQMTRAFEEVSKKVNPITFKETLISPDIRVTCSKESNNFEEKDYFIAGEGGAKEIIQTGKYNLIVTGLILLYPTQKNSIQCNDPNTEIHELMHVLGFGHSQDKNSLMYPILESCEQKLDESIITELIKLYSEENLPDLYFEEAKIVRKGRYIDFNISIKNSGTIDTQNVNLTILDEGKIVEEKNLDEIKIGAGIMLETLNLKMINRDSKKIEFILDPENKIRELNETNNKVIFKFD